MIRKKLVTHVELHKYRHLLQQRAKNAGFNLLQPYLTVNKAERVRHTKQLFQNVRQVTNISTSRILLCFAAWQPNMDLSHVGTI